MNLNEKINSEGKKLLVYDVFFFFFNLKKNELPGATSDLSDQWLFGLKRRQIFGAMNLVLLTFCVTGVFIVFYWLFKYLTLWSRLSKSIPGRPSYPFLGDLLVLNGVQTDGKVEI